MSGIRSRVLGIGRMAFGLALFAYVLSVTDGWAATRNLLTTPLALLAVCLTPILGAAIESIRLGLLFKPAGVRLTFGRGYALVAVATLFNFAIPGGTGGDVMKIYYLAGENRGRGVEVATVLVMDRGVAMMAWLMVVLVLALGNLELIGQEPVLQALVGMTVAGVVGGLVTLGVIMRWNVSPTFLARWKLGRVVLGVIDRILGAINVYREHKTTLVAAGMLSAVGQFILAGVFIFVASQIMSAAQSGVVGFLFLLGLLANALPLTPGGLGVGEAAMDRLFNLVGISGAAVLLVAWRIGMIPLSAFGFYKYSMGMRRVREAEYRGRVADETAGAVGTR